MSGKKTIIGLIAIAVPYVASFVEYANQIPHEILPPQAKLIIGGAGWLLALYGRLVAAGPIIK